MSIIKYQNSGKVFKPLNFNSGYTPTGDNTKTNYNQEAKIRFDKEQYDNQKEKDYQTAIKTKSDVAFKEKYKISPHRYKYDTDPQYKAKTDRESKVSAKINGSIDFPSGDLRRKDQENPATMWMNPNLRGESNKQATNFHNTLIGSVLPLPGLQNVGKIPSVFKLGKNLTKGIELSSHLQGDEALKMFKEYGGKYPQSQSILIQDIEKYGVPEARQRYGLLNNTNVSDKEIASSLYKHIDDLQQTTNSKYLNEFGEPMYLHRGTPVKSNVLIDKQHPDYKTELSTKRANEGLYFTRDKDYAQFFAKEGETNSFFLRGNPKTSRAFTPEQYHDTGIENISKARKNNLLNEGYNGISINDGNEVVLLNNADAKSILPYDLRLPRNWNSTNIFKQQFPSVVVGSKLITYKK